MTYRLCSGLLIRFSRVQLPVDPPIKQGGKIMNIAESSLFRISLTTIRESAKDLSEIETDKTKEKLSLIKKHIIVCEKLLGKELK